MNRYKIDLSGSDFEVGLYVHADSLRDVTDMFVEYRIVRLQHISPDDHTDSIRDVENWEAGL